MPMGRTRGSWAHSKHHISILAFTVFLCLIFHVTLNSRNTNLKNHAIEWGWLDIWIVLRVSFRWCALFTELNWNRHNKSLQFCTICFRDVQLLNYRTLTHLFVNIISFIIISNKISICINLILICNFHHTSIAAVQSVLMNLDQGFI